MTKEQILRMIKEYQDYSRNNDYPMGEEEINQEELEVHEQIANALRQELEKDPDFFKNLDDVKIKEHIEKKFNGNKKS